jgi:hypothetical protein
VRSFVVVVPHVLVEDPHKLASTQISIQSRHSRRTVLTQRSANAFARGARTDVVVTSVQGDTSSIVGKPPKVPRQQHDERGTFQPYDGVRCRGDPPGSTYRRTRRAAAL